LPEGIERNDRPSDHDSVTRAMPEAYRGAGQHTQDRHVHESTGPATGEQR
jgi:hypothetical protein